MPLTVAAVADIHSPRYVHLLITSTSNLVSKDVKVDLVILAGDSVEKNNVAGLRIVIDVLNKLKNKHGEAPPIIAVFGNEEYLGYEHEYKRLYPQIKWVDEDSLALDIEGTDVCVVGSRGALLKPTIWQQKHVPDIESMYKARVLKIKEMLRLCRKHQLSILVTHYAPAFATLEGEDLKIRKFLGYPIVETLNNDEKPNLVIHGHAHNSVKTFAIVNNVPVYNVSLPATKNITLIVLPL